MVSYYAVVTLFLIPTSLPTFNKLIGSKSSAPKPKLRVFGKLVKNIQGSDLKINLLGAGFSYLFLIIAINYFTCMYSNIPTRMFSKEFS